MLPRDIREYISQFLPPKNVQRLGITSQEMSRFVGRINTSYVVDINEQDMEDRCLRLIMGHPLNLQVSLIDLVDHYYLGKDIKRLVITAKDLRSFNENYVSLYLTYYTREDNGLIPLRLIDNADIEAAVNAESNPSIIRDLEVCHIVGSRRTSDFLDNNNWIEIKEYFVDHPDYRIQVYQLNPERVVPMLRSLEGSPEQILRDLFRMSSSLDLYQVIIKVIRNNKIITIYYGMQMKSGSAIPESYLVTVPDQNYGDDVITTLAKLPLIMGGEDYKIYYQIVG